MKPKEFYDAVVAMRNAQKMYEHIARTKSGFTENAKKDADAKTKIVDDEIARVNLIMSEQVKKMQKQFEITGLETQ